jgi:hypothetical protein
MFKSLMRINLDCLYGWYYGILVKTNLHVPLRTADEGWRLSLPSSSNSRQKFGTLKNQKGLKKE